MKVSNLDPQGLQKSFYGKAQVIRENNISKLKSYNTIVAEYNHNTNEINVFGWYSTTTARHINAFLMLHGFDKANKAKMDNWNNNA